MPLPPRRLLALPLCTMLPHHHFSSRRTVPDGRSGVRGGKQVVQPVTERGTLRCALFLRLQPADRPFYANHHLTPSSLSSFSSPLPSLPSLSVRISLRTNSMQLKKVLLDRGWSFAQAVNSDRSLESFVRPPPLPPLRSTLNPSLSGVGGVLKEEVGKMPTVVHSELLRLGRIEDPNKGMNEWECQCSSSPSPPFTFHGGGKLT